MRVLQIVCVYPTKTNKYANPVYKQQIDSLSALGVENDVLVVSGRMNKLSALLTLKQKLKKTNYNLIHAYYVYSGFIAVMQKKVPVLVSFLGSDVYRKNQRLISSWVSRRSNANIVMSDNMKEMLSLDEAHVIPEGINLGMFKPMPKQLARKKLGLGDEEKIILFGAKTSRYSKNYPLAEECFERVKSHFPQAKMIIMDKTDHQQVPYFMNASDCLLITSRYEGSPNIVKEAMACDLPIVSVDVGDVKYTIKDTKSCFICSYDSNDLSNAVLTIFENPGKTNGRENISQLELGHVAKNIFSIYKELAVQKI